MKNKITAVLLTGAILAAMLCGCSYKKGNENSDTDDKQEIKTLEKTDSEIVDQLIQTIISSPAEQSAVSAYIYAHREQFDSIVAMDTAALKVMFEKFEGDGQTGLYGAVMQIACENILGGENISIIDVSSPQEWYDTFKGHVVRIANLNSADFIKENNPKSYVLLEALNYENRGYDSSKYLTEEELSTEQGVKLGMTYEQVLEIIGEPDEKFDNDTTVKSFKKDGVLYGFYKIDDSFDRSVTLPRDDNFYLLNITMSEEDGFNGAAPREIRMGDSIEEVFLKFPVKDTTLRKWAEQAVYGTQKQGNPRATLMYTTVLGTYHICFVTENGVMNVHFDKKNNVKQIDIILEKA